MSASDDRCRALTTDGERCTRPARSDGYCYQHDSDDETIEESEETEEDTTDEGEDQESRMSDDDYNIDDTEIGQIRNKVRNIAEDVVGYPLSGILAIDREEDGWRVAVEVIERNSVPDTQDILGRYEITLDEDRNVIGYRRTHRYRRDDMEQDI